MRQYAVTIGLALMLGSSGAGLRSAEAWADEAPTSETSPSPSASPAVDPGFIALPAFDFSAPASSPRVGDRVKLGLSHAGLPKGARKLALPPDPTATEKSDPATALMDQGWGLSFPDELGVVAVPLQPGKQILPSLQIVDAAGKAVGRTNPLTVDVLSAIGKDDPEPAKPAPVLPPMPVDFPWWVAALLGLLALLVIGLAIWGLVRWSASRKLALANLPPKPPRADHEVAMDALQALGRENLVQKGEYKRFYFGISEILKIYLGSRYGVSAPESTTDELIQALENAKAAPDPILDRIESLFSRLDRIKFTDQRPSADDAAADFQDAVKIVMETRRPTPVVLVGASPGAREGSDASR